MTTGSSPAMSRTPASDSAPSAAGPISIVRSSSISTQHLALRTACQMSASLTPSFAPAHLCARRQRILSTAEANRPAKSLCFFEQVRGRPLETSSCGYGWTSHDVHPAEGDR